MATLTGNAINTSYQGLIKTDDNGALSALSLKQLSDGLGNTAPIALSQTSICIGSLASASVIEAYSNGMTLANQTNTDGILFNSGGVDFTGNMDFSGATVTGLPTAAGLVSGTGADSLKNADSLVTNPATAAGPGSIALGDGATVAGAFSGIAIGCSACTVTNGTAVGPQAETIGNQATAIGIRACADDQAVAIGRQSVASGLSSIAIGDDNDATAACAIAIGRTASANGVNGIAIGNGACSAGVDGIAIGCNARNQAPGPRAIAIGCNAFGIDDNSVAIGTSSTGNFAAIGIGSGSCANGYQSIALGQSAIAQARAIAIGCDASASGSYAVALAPASSATATNSVAIGCGVTAAKADTVTVKELETCVAGGGIYLTTPDGLAQPKLTVDNTCALLIDGSPVGGGGGAAGLVAGTGADSLKNADSLVTIAAVASGSCTLSLGDSACATSGGNMALGYGARALGDTAFDRRNIAIGPLAFADVERALAIGLQAAACQGRTVAVGCGTVASASRATTVGSNSQANGFNSVTVGSYSQSIGESAVTIGGFGSVACCNFSIVIGRQSISNAVEAVAIGCGVTATKACTVTVKSLETCVAGEGVIMTTPDGLNQYKITVDNSGTLVSTLVV